jgi:hypothetical protein
MICRIALVLLLALVASPASAARAPKSLCLSVAGGSYQMVLVAKKVGTATTAAGKTTFYQLAGEASFPAVETSILLAGSGRLAGDTLDFQVTGSNLRELDLTYAAVHYQGTWDVVQRTGAISNLYLSGNGAAQALTETGSALAETDCEMIQLYP